MKRKSKDGFKKISLSVPVALYEELEKEGKDHLTGRLKYGFFSQLTTRLLINWLEERKKQRNETMKNFGVKND